MRGENGLERLLEPVLPEAVLPPCWARVLIGWGGGLRGDGYWR